MDAIERTPIEFYLPETPVEFGGELGGATKGVVISVQIKPAGILYEIAYLDDGGMKEVWVHAFLVRPCEPLHRMGFATPPPKSVE